MNVGPLTGGAPAASPRAGSLTSDQRSGIAADLRLLAWMQSAESQVDVLAQLAESGFPDGLALRLDTGRGKEAALVLATALADLKTADRKAAQDELAVDFAAIYLNYTYKAAPSESVWFDDEQLAMQDAMFAVRDWYTRYGMASPDWRQFPDDHICLQLQFVAELLERGQEMEAARFLDEHLLRWIDLFAGRVAARCATPFHAGLVMLCSAYADLARDVLAASTGVPRADAGRNEPPSTKPR